MSSNLDAPLTLRIYSDLQTAYDYFNRELFDGRLPEALLVLSYHRGANGYFRSKPFVPRDQLGAYDEWQAAVLETPDDSPALESIKPGVDEISLNIFTFRDRTVQDIMSTLVHEMVHLEQFHFGEDIPKRIAHHNREWGSLMKRVGLYPSATGAPGGKETGRRMTHYVVEGGPFEAAVENLPVTLDWVGLLPLKKKKEREPKVTYCCPDCEARVRGKAGLNIRCDDCDQVMGPPEE